MCMAQTDHRETVSKFPWNIQQIGPTDNVSVDRYDLIYTQLYNRWCVPYKRGAFVPRRAAYSVYPVNY